MYRIVQHVSCSGATAVVDKIVNKDQVSIKSRASLVLLQEKLYNIEQQEALARKDYEFLLQSKKHRNRNKKLYRKHIVNFNCAVMSSFRNARLGKNNLICVFCGKDDLHIGGWWKSSNQNTVTADHFIPVSKGGGQFDASNLVPCCNSCNSTKGNEIYELDTLQYLNHYSNHELVLQSLRQKLTDYKENIIN